MNYCTITYEPVDPGRRYSEKGLKQISPTLKQLRDFPYSAEEQRFEAEARSSKLSIQGVQPKLSVGLNVKDSTFDIVDRGGRYIFKPQIQNYPSVPENEDLTMRLAKMVGIEIPLHGLVYCKDGSLSYFIRRFDRRGQKTKLHVEDFAQLSGETRNTKYDSSMEKVAQVVERYCTFPVLEKSKLFLRTLFSFVVGNEDMHLKNFSLIARDDKIELSPAYDLVNSTIVVGNPKEEMALALRGRKNRLSKADLIDYFGKQFLDLTQATLDDIVGQLEQAIPGWKETIERSFLPDGIRDKYRAVISDRAARIGIRF